jgi:hypothetical protein
VDQLAFLDSQGLFRFVPASDHFFFCFCLGLWTIFHFRLVWTLCVCFWTWTFFAALLFPRYSHRTISLHSSSRTELLQCSFFFRLVVFVFYSDWWRWVGGWVMSSLGDIFSLQSNTRRRWFRACCVPLG